MRRLLFVLLTATSVLQARDIAGKVIAIEGVATASSPERSNRRLARGVAVFSNDTIQVSHNSKVQIRFMDGAFLNLIPETVYEIVDYSYGGTAPPQHKSSLTKGGLRYLSGNIGKTHPEAVEVQTPTATVGLRGTVLDLLLLPDGRLNVGCFKGRVEIRNYAGSILIGPTEPTSYATIISPTTEPQPVVEPIPSLTPEKFSSPASGVPITAEGESAQSSSGMRIHGGC